MSDTADQPELNLPAAPIRQSSGRVFDTKRQFTLPLTRSLSSARVVGRWSETDRKLWVTLVSIAFNELGSTHIHSVNYHKIAVLFKELGPVRNGTSWIIDSAQKLHTAVFAWEDDEEIGTTSLLSGLKINKKNGEISYTFDHFLKQKLLINEEFSRIRLHFMIKLNGKYSVSLYMILQNYVNLRKPVAELSIEHLRSALGIPDGKLKRFVDLERNAISPAVDQINQNAMAAGFSVEASRITLAGRTVGMRFKVAKVENDFPPVETGGETLDDEKNHFPKTHPISPTIDDEEALRIIRRELAGIDAQAALVDFRSEIEGREIINVLGYLTSWCRRRLKNTSKIKSIIDNAASLRRIVD